MLKGEDPLCPGAARTGAGDQHRLPVTIPGEGGRPEGRAHTPSSYERSMVLPGVRVIDVGLLSEEGRVRRGEILLQRPLKVGGGDPSLHTVVPGGGGQPHA